MDVFKRYILITTTKIIQNLQKNLKTTDDKLLENIIITPTKNLINKKKNKKNSETICSDFYDKYLCKTSLLTQKKKINK